MNRKIRHDIVNPIWWYRWYGDGIDGGHGYKYKLETSGVGLLVSLQW